jgi:hypothetical protein
MYQTNLKDKILEATNLDQHYLKIKENLYQGNLQHKFKNYELKKDGILLHKGKVYVSNSIELKNIMPREMHDVSYAGHPGYHKSITTVRSQHFWPRMKKKVVNYLAHCLEWQKVKIEHKHPTRLLQPFPIPKWKWEVVTIYFITKLPRTMKQHDSFMAVVDKLSNATHLFSQDNTQGNKYCRDLHEGSL